MFTFTKAFSGFSVDDIEKAREFYGEILGLKISDQMGALQIHLSDDVWVFVYPKPNHAPASYTMLNFEVEDIGKAVAELKEKGVSLENYPGTDTGPDGISRSGDGPAIAWFKDPSGNILSVLQK